MTAGTPRFDRAQIRARLIGLLAALVVAPVVVLGLASVAAFDRAIEPELANRTRLIGTIVRSEIQRNLDLGIPFRALVGLDAYLAETLESFGEVDRIVVGATSGATIAEVERAEPAAPSLLLRAGLGEVVGLSHADFTLPILSGNELVGEILVAANPRLVEIRLRNVFLDVMVIAIVATLVALELALAVATGSVGKPLDRVLTLLGEQREGEFLHRVRAGGLSGLGRAATRLNDQAIDLAERFAQVPAALRARVENSMHAHIADGFPTRLRLSDFNDIRLALFLFSLVTEIGASFLPLYARAAARPIWLSPDLAAAAPLAVYLIAVAVLSPFGGALARRFGPRHMFLASVPPTAIALVGIGLSDSLLAISLWRGIIAASYAVATIACQEYAFRSAAEGTGTRAAGAFVAVVYAGVFCGSALGGVIASRLGFAAAFYTGGAIAVVSGAIAMMIMAGRAGDPMTPTRLVYERPAETGSFTPYFLALLGGIVVPMNATTALFIWYLTPLMLAASGYGPAEIARVVMLYYLAVVVVGPIVSRLSDGRLGPVPLIIFGPVVSGLALLSLAFWGSVWAVAVAVAAVGIGHALIRAPQYVLAPRLAASHRGLNALRLVERLGALLGLVLGAISLGGIGASSTLRVLGFVVLTGVALFVIIERIQRHR